MEYMEIVSWLDRRILRCDLYQLPVSIEIVDAAIFECANYYTISGKAGAELIREAPVPGFINYRIVHDTSGDLGEIHLKKISDNYTTFDIHEPRGMIKQRDYNDSEISLIESQPDQYKEAAEKQIFGKIYREAREQEYQIYSRFEAVIREIYVHLLTTGPNEKPIFQSEEVLELMLGNIEESWPDTAAALRKCIGAAQNESNLADVESKNTIQAINPDETALIDISNEAKENRRFTKDDIYQAMNELGNESEIFYKLPDLQIDTSSKLFHNWLSRLVMRHTMLKHVVGSNGQGEIYPALANVDVLPWQEVTLTILGLQDLPVPEASIKCPYPSFRLIRIQILDLSSSPEILQVKIEYLYEGKKYLIELLEGMLTAWPKRKEEIKSYINLIKGASDFRPAEVEAGKPGHPPHKEIVRDISVPLAPDEPKPGDSLDMWFDYYHERKRQGYRVTLQDIANKSGWAYSTVKQKHSAYLDNHPG